MRRLVCAALAFSQVVFGWQTPAARLDSIGASKTAPEGQSPVYQKSDAIGSFTARYTRPSMRPLALPAAARAETLLRDGKLYLSLYDAVAMAIENNLDVEVARYNLSIATTDRLRASGGGNLRGLDYSVSESPTGVGGPGSPLLNSAASSVTPTTPTVNDLTSLNILSSTSSNLAVQSQPGYSTGPPVPLLQPTLVGQTTFFNRANSSILLAGAPGSGQVTNSDTLHFVAANYALVEGFRYGTQVEVAVNNAAQVLYGDKSRYNPFSAPNTSVTLTQPLLRGRSSDVNLRYLKIAAINQKVSRLLFFQQLISTVYGISRLYYDLVSLTENVQVKRETLTASRKLFEDEKAQVDEGTLAPLELTRAQSLVSSSELDLIQAQGLVEQQAVILKTQLARRGTADPVLGPIEIIPTDRISVPQADGDGTSIDGMVMQALRLRPDLLQASLQVQSGEISVEASQNAIRPELDLVGNFQTRGSSESPFATIGTPGTGQIVAPADLGVAGLRLSRIYQAGIQLNLPLRNHVAQADAARDLVQLRQAQARTQILENQVREQVENASIALRTARSALNAAIQSRQYQEQLVEAEKDKLSVGASTSFLVIQQASYLAQARSTEVASRSVWVKARIALDRAIGSLLEKNGISYDDSVLGHLPSAPQH